MKALVFCVFILVQTPCNGQCPIDLEYIDSFCLAFPKYEIENSNGVYSYGNGYCIVTSPRLYFLSVESGLDTAIENKIFYDIVHNSGGKKKNVLRFLKSHSLDSLTAEILAGYMLCRHEPKYIKWAKKIDELNMERGQNPAFRQVPQDMMKDR